MTNVTMGILLALTIYRYIILCAKALEFLMILESFSTVGIRSTSDDNQVS